MLFTTFIIISHSDWLFDRTFTCWKTVEDSSSYCLTVKLNVQLNLHPSKFCMKLDRLILKKIIKIVATRCQILRLKCTQFDFGWGSVPDPTGGAYSAPPDPLAGFQKIGLCMHARHKDKEYTSVKLQYTAVLRLHTGICEEKFLDADIKVISKYNRLFLRSRHTSHEFNEYSSTNFHYYWQLTVKKQCQRIRYLLLHGSKHATLACKKGYLFAQNTLKYETENKKTRMQV